MKETRLSRKEFNLLVNDILLDVKPIKLRISIANRLVEFFDKKQEQIAELEEQLKNARKETAKKVIDRVEELSVFDFEAYEEMDFRRYIVSQMALDNILKEYGE